MGIGQVLPPIRDLAKRCFSHAKEFSKMDPRELFYKSASLRLRDLHSGLRNAVGCRLRTRAKRVECNATRSDDER